jgi:hypothetical protein
MVNGDLLATHLAAARDLIIAAEQDGDLAKIRYAALELRLAIERFAAELLARIQNGNLSASDHRSLSGFKKTEKRIAALAGNPQVIRRTYAFQQILLDLMNLEIRLTVPDMNVLSTHWHYCSELLHIRWALSIAAADDESAVVALRELSDVGTSLVKMSEGLLVWPSIADVDFERLKQQFLRGEVRDEDIRDWLKARGVWASVVTPDGERTVIGSPVPPASVSGV